MTFSFTSNLKQVGITPGVLMRFRPREVSTVVIRATGTITIGSAGLTTSNGLILVAGGTFGFSHQDFSPEMLKENADVVIYAVAPAATTAAVALLSR